MHVGVSLLHSPSQIRPFYAEPSLVPLGYQQGLVPLHFPQIPTQRRSTNVAGIVPAVVTVIIITIIISSVVIIVSDDPIPYR